MTSYAFHSPNRGCWVLVRSTGRHGRCEVSEPGFLVRLDEVGRVLLVDVEHEEPTVLVDFDLLAELSACPDPHERYCLLADHPRYNLSHEQCSALAERLDLIPLLVAN